MASKDFVFDDGLQITIYKRKGSRNLRLSLTPRGQVRVTIPAWAPYKVGIEFARSRRKWIESERRLPGRLKDGQAIGKAHHLSLEQMTSAKSVTSRLNDSLVVVRYPELLDDLAPEVQKAAKDASIRALRKQAEQLLPQRLGYLADKYDFSYNDVSIKLLRGRWGSCDQQSNIVLNLFLMQLPWDLIDYVLLHELTHTRVMKHGPEFWKAMEEIRPGVKALRQQLRTYNPVLDGSS